MDSRVGTGPMPLRHRVRLLLGLFAALLVVSLVVDVWLIGDRASLVRRVDDELDPARLAVAELTQGLVDQETAERGFVITHDESFLEPYERGEERVDEALDALDRLLSDEASLRAGVQRLRSRIGAWRQLGAEFEIAAVRAGRFDEAVALVSSGTGRELFDRARAEIDDVRDGLIAERAAVEDDIRSIRDLLSVLTVGGAVLALVLLALGAHLLRRWVTGPIEVLSRSVREVADGHLDRAISAGGPPEIAGLGDDVEAMRRRILAEVDDASRARQALAQRGLVVLSLSERLHPGATVLPPGIDVVTRHVPASGVVAGDWCDVVPLGPGRAAVALVDVSGHGAEAGIFALRTKELTLAAIGSGYDPGAALAWVAARLGDTDERFLTGVIAEIDDTAGTMRYASAGHPPLLMVDAGRVTTLGRTGPLLGPALGDLSWSTAEVALSPTAIVVGYSDGVVEARNAAGEEFGLERLAVVVADAASDDDLDALADRCLRALEEFDALAHHDDVTLVVFGRSPSPVPVGAVRETAAEV